MDLTTGQEKIAERLAELLIASPIDEALKSSILENLDQMPMHHMVKLMEFLTEQGKELSTLETNLDDLVRQHQAEWRALEKKQDATAMAMVDDAVAGAMEGAVLQEDLQNAEEEGV